MGQVRRSEFYTEGPHTSLLCPVAWAFTLLMKAYPGFMDRGESGVRDAGPVSGLQHRDCWGLIARGTDL
jgi:hypothetical protein